MMSTQIQRKLKSFSAQLSKLTPELEFFFFWLARFRVQHYNEVVIPPPTGGVGWGGEGGVRVDLP